MKNNKVKVSATIPIYDTEKYTWEAILGVAQQSLKGLEIIIINDGSTDGSLDIIEEISDKNSRIHIYTRTNQGLSKARNAGVNHARGKYICFTDSDDLLEEDAMKICYLKCEGMRLGFVFFGTQSFYDSNVKNVPPLDCKRTDKLENKVYIGNEALELQLQDREYMPSACLNFIHKDFLNSINLWFYPDITHGDQPFTTLLYLQTTGTTCIKRAFFQRHMRENSVMIRKLTYRSMEGYLVVTQETLNFKEQVTENKNKAIIDLYSP